VCLPLQYLAQCAPPPRGVVRYLLGPAPPLVTGAYRLRSPSVWTKSQCAPAPAPPLLPVETREMLSFVGELGRVPLILTTPMYDSQSQHSGGAGR